MAKKTVKKAASAPVKKTEEKKASSGLQTHVPNVVAISSPKKEKAAKE